MSQHDVVSAQKMMEARVFALVVQTNSLRLSFGESQTAAARLCSVTEIGCLYRVEAACGPGFKTDERNAQGVPGTLLGVRVLAPCAHSQHPLLEVQKMLEQTPPSVSRCMELTLSSQNS